METRDNRIHSSYLLWHPQAEYWCPYITYKVASASVLLQLMKTATFYIQPNVSYFMIPLYQTATVRLCCVHFIGPKILSSRSYMHFQNKWIQGNHYMQYHGHKKAPVNRLNNGPVNCYTINETLNTQ
jgi:hypothetical protein